MNLNDVISDFEQRKLHIDFLEMSLTQNKSGVKVISYTGKGYVEQTDDDVLFLKMYVNETANTSLFDEFKNLNQTKSGELYPDDSYYTLSGIAADGTTWKAEHVLPACKWHVQHPNPIVDARLSSITGGELARDPKSLEMHFFEKADLPVLSRKARFTVGRYDFHVEGGDDSFIIGADSDVPLPEHFGMRIEEALRFLLAQSVTPRAIVQHHSVLLLTSTTPKSPVVRLGRPISRGSAAFHDKSWDLFGAYLVFVTEKTKFGNWHPCTGYLHMAREASANSLDAWAIGIAVAVEGLARLVNIEHDTAEDEKRNAERKRLKDLQTFIVEQVSSQECLKRYTDRVKGIVSSLTSVRAIDRLFWLADHGGAERSHVNAWRKLRNRGVHPATTEDKDIASLDYQELVDEVHSVTILLYHIVFHVIAYDGPYTDYGTRNFRNCSPHPSNRLHG